MGRPNNLQSDCMQNGRESQYCEFLGRRGSTHELLGSRELLGPDTCMPRGYLLAREAPPGAGRRPRARRREHGGATNTCTGNEDADHGSAVQCSDRTSYYRMLLTDQ